MTTYKDSILFPHQDWTPQQNRIINAALSPSVNRAKRARRAAQLAKSFDHWSHAAERDIELVQKQLQEVNLFQKRMEVDKIVNELKANRDRGRFYAWNPRQQRAVKAIMDPINLLTVYSHPWRFIQLEDEAEHNVRKVDDVYRLKPNEKTLPIRFRDENNFLIISDLEVYKNGDLDTLAPRRPAPRSTKDSLLFSRNWPMTEKNKGKSFQEFIRR